MRVFLCLLISGLSAMAGELISFNTLSGEKFEQVSVSVYSPLEISVTSAGGIKHVPFTNLPPELRTKLGYDAAKADQYVKAMAIAVARQKQSEAVQKHAEQVEWTRQQKAERDARRAELQDYEDIDAAVLRQRLIEIYGGAIREEDLRSALRARYIQTGK